MPADFFAEGTDPKPDDSERRSLVKAVALLNDLVLSSMSAPFFPEGTDPKPDDSARRSLVKVVALLKDLVTGGLGGGTSFTSGTGAPSNESGNVGDWYLNNANQRLYEKTGASTWTYRAQLVP